MSTTSARSRTTPTSTAAADPTCGRAQVDVRGPRFGGAVTTAVSGFGPDILVNNTGATGAIEFPPRPFQDTDPASWRPLVDINLYGTLNCTHAALPTMVEAGWGRIVTIISDAGRKGEPGMPVYGAAKAASAGFVRAIAAEYGRQGITANCLAFGTIRYADMGDPDPERERKMLRPYSTKPFGDPTDPVAMAVLLASDHAAWITGQVTPVNGGYTQAL